MSKKILATLACALILAGAAQTAAAAETGCTPDCASERNGKAFVRVEAGRTLEDNAPADVFSLRGGYWFNDNFAIEGSYTQWNIPHHEEWGTNLNGRWDVGLGVVGFFISGRAGLALEVYEGRRWESKRIVPTVGVGAGYDFTDRFGLNVNYDSANTLTAGAEWRF